MRFGEKFQFPSLVAVYFLTSLFPQKKMSCGLTYGMRGPPGRDGAQGPPGKDGTVQLVVAAGTDGTVVMSPPTADGSRTLTVAASCSCSVPPGPATQVGPHGTTTSIPDLGVEPADDEKVPLITMFDNSDESQPAIIAGDGSGISRGPTITSSVGFNPFPAPIPKSTECALIFHVPHIGKILQTDDGATWTFIEGDSFYKPTHTMRQEIGSLHHGILLKNPFLRFGMIMFPYLNVIMSASDSGVIVQRLLTFRQPTDVEKSGIKPMRYTVSLKDSGLVYYAPYGGPANPFPIPFETGHVMIDLLVTGITSDSCVTTSYCEYNTLIDQNRVEDGKPEYSFIIPQIYGANPVSISAYIKIVPYTYTYTVYGMSFENDSTPGASIKNCDVTGTLSIKSITTSEGAVTATLYNLKRLGSLPSYDGSKWTFKYDPISSSDETITVGVISDPTNVSSTDLLFVVDSTEDYKAELTTSDFHPTLHVLQSDNIESLGKKPTEDMKTFITSADSTPCYHVTLADAVKYYMFVIVKSRK